jgi:hypothetical protein
MAPEIAAVYVIGMIPAGIFSSFHYFRRKARSQSRSAKQLQNNLRKVGLCWIDLNGEISPYRANFESSQAEALKKTFVTAGIATVVASWIGLLFHILIFLSYEKFAVTHLEQRVFNSDLIRKDLGVEQIQVLLTEIQSLRL